MADHDATGPTGPTGPAGPAAEPPGDSSDSAGSQRASFNAELSRTAFQRKAVSPLAVPDVLDLATAYFRERGYRVGRTGRPGQLFVMGGAEGGLPRVTGEVNAQANVGRGRTTLIRLDAAGERLGPTMAGFQAVLRAERDRRRRAEATPQPEPDTGEGTPPPAED